MNQRIKSTPRQKRQILWPLFLSLRADCFGLVATVSPAFDRWTFQVPAPQCDEAREWNSANELRHWARAKVGGCDKKTSLPALIQCPSSPSPQLYKQISLAMNPLHLHTHTHTHTHTLSLYFRNLQRNVCVCVSIQLTVFKSQQLISTLIQRARTSPPFSIRVRASMHIHIFLF